MAQGRKKASAKKRGGNATAPGNALPEAAAVPATAMTEGQRRLRERVARESFGEIASMLGVNKGTIHRWCTGEKSPGPAARAKIEEKLGIPNAAWGRAAGTSEKTSSTPVAKAKAILQGAARASSQVEFDELLTSMRSIGVDDLLAMDAARILKMRWDMLEQAEKRRRVDEDRFVDHPSFRRLTRALVAALRPYPDALRAAVAELQALEA